MEFKDRKFKIHKVNNTCQCRLLLFIAVQAEIQMVLLNNQNWGWCKKLWSALRLKYGDTWRLFAVPTMLFGDMVNNPNIIKRTMHGEPV